MIDYEKRTPGRKEFLTAVALTAAVLIIAGTISLRGGAGAETAANRTEASGGTEIEDSRISSLEAEINAENTAAYSRIRRDGAYASRVLMPAGDKTFTQKELILINPWHLLPENYEADLENVEYGHRMDACAAEHLRDMLADCREAGCSPLVCSSYRDRYKQETLFQSDVRRFMYRGYSEEEAIEETARNVAIPGSSEHEAGLAADIVYVGRQSLDENQELNDTQQWLMEHCWEYGFILRYPKDKQDITGITYEPWHYRYVGMEAAEEITSRGICLEEYLGVIDAEEQQEEREETQED